MSFSFDNFLAYITNSDFYKGQLVHVEESPARRARYGKLGVALPEALEKALESVGIKKLYLHQTKAIDALAAGQNVTIVTGTASGKTLCYNIPVLSSLIEDFTSRALYLYPTKALAQDQLKGLQRLLDLLPGVSALAGTYDGDTPQDARQKLRDSGSLVLTNPDMLHSGILPNHARWARFFGKLKYIVIDEIHSYRGVFGSNVAEVLRRLNRICERYGANPQYVCCSATIRNPGELAEQLTERLMTVVDEDGAPKGPRKFVFWNPPFVETEPGLRRSPNTEAQFLMVELIKQRIPTICFVPTRSGTELVFRYVQDELQKESPRLAKRVCTYRGGYLPSERRELERKLFAGEMLGVVSTNALELGIDIGALQACIIAGFPGTINSTLQQAGRAGRGKDEALVALIARNTPIDQYIMHHPEYFLGRTPESAIIDPENPYILSGHLPCAARELPLTEGEAQSRFGKYAPGVLDLLAEGNQLRFLSGQWYYGKGGFPAARVKLRNTTAGNYTIVDTSGSRNFVIGEQDEISAFYQLHTEAVYLHLGETYFVKKLDLEKRQAFVVKEDVDYYTQAVDDTSIVVRETELTKPLRQATVDFGPVDVTTTVFMFRKIKFGSFDSIGFGNLDLPPRTLGTMAMWLVPPRETLSRVQSYNRVPGDGLLGISNVLGAVLPIFTMCDPRDVGTTVDVTNTPLPAIYVYDKVEGGVGYAERGYEVVEDILQAALVLVNDCPCSRGCPSCVGAPIPPWAFDERGISSRGFLPDKEAAKVILHDLLGLEPYVPPPLTQEEEAIRQGRVLESTDDKQRATDRMLPEGVEKRLRDRLRKHKS